MVDISRKRRPDNGPETRRVLETLKARNIFGKVVPLMKICKCCNKPKLLSEFYIESSSKKNSRIEVRDTCLICWDDSKGKLTTSRPIANDLGEFIDRDTELV